MPAPHDADDTPTQPDDLAPRADEVDDADLAAGNDLGIDDPTATSVDDDTEGD